MDRFIFETGENIDENDDVIGCIADDRTCICSCCGKDCIYRGSMRGEVA